MFSAISSHHATNNLPHSATRHQTAAEPPPLYSQVTFATDTVTDTNTSLKTLARRQQRTAPSSISTPATYVDGTDTPQAPAQGRNDTSYDTSYDTANNRRTGDEQQQQLRDLDGQRVCATSSMHCYVPTSVSRPQAYSPHSTTSTSTTATHHNHDHKHNHIVDKQSTINLPHLQHNSLPHLQHLQQPSSSFLQHPSDSHMKAGPPNETR